MKFWTGLGWLLSKLLSFFVKIKSFLPAGLIGVFVFFNLFVNAKEHGLSAAFQIAAKSLLAAETTIRDNVQLAIANDPSYGFPEVFAIAISLYILYRFIKIIGQGLIKLTGSQAEWMAYFVGLLITGLIEYTAVIAIDGEFAFIPIYHGIIFLIMNLGPVINNIHFFGMQLFDSVMATNESINITENLHIESLNLTK